jgi:6-phosphofructokinase 1
MSLELRIGIFTSGGDSCGMNCRRARMHTHRASGVERTVFAIKDGFSRHAPWTGMVERLEWGSVGGIHGTRRHRDRHGAMRRVPHCRGRSATAPPSTSLSRGINALVCIGGDGSLTGADTLLNEWPTHLAALRG